MSSIETLPPRQVNKLNAPIISTQGVEDSERGELEEPAKTNGKEHDEEVKHITGLNNSNNVATPSPPRFEEMLTCREELMLKHEEKNLQSCVVI